MANQKIINVGIVGAAGFAGAELIDLLLKHPYARIADVSAKTDRKQKFSDLYPRFKGRMDLVCSKTDLKEISRKCDLVFLALPHTASMSAVPKLLQSGKRVIDLSADYRLKDAKVYEQFYQAAHKDKANLAKAVYGLPEFYRLKIKDADLVANPGCYPTAAILGLAPLLACGLADPGSVIIDAKSGVSGAGKKLTEGFLFSEINGDFKAYKVNTHQHMPEINQVLSALAGSRVSIVFVPHLLPIYRGILETIYVKKTNDAKHKPVDLVELYKKFYKSEPFVRIKEKGQFPRISDVEGTNFCDIGITEDADHIIVISAIDNLLKGASGQAVQNMNLMYDFPERTGLL